MDREEDKIVPKRFKEDDELLDGESFDRENALQTLIQQIDKHTDDAKKLLADEENTKEPPVQERRKRKARNKKEGKKKGTGPGETKRRAGNTFWLHGIITVMAINIIGLGYLFYLSNARITELESSVEEIIQTVSQNEKDIEGLKKAPNIAPSIPMTELVGRVGGNFESVKKQKKEKAEKRRTPPGNKAVTSSSAKQRSPSKTVVKRGTGTWRVVLASFETLGDAKRWQTNMEERGIQTSVQPIKIHGTIWYRVYTGGWMTADEARSQIPGIARITGIQDLWITRMGDKK